MNVELADFNHMSHRGEKVSLDDLKGKPWLGMYIFTNCNTVCFPMTENMSYAFSVATIIREKGISTEVCYNRKTVKSMLNYANKLNIPYVIFIGEDEIANGNITIKDMETGEQTVTKAQEIEKYIN